MDINYNAVVMYITEYESFFNENYSLLLERYERFKELREKYDWCLDTETYFDMMIVQLRSLILDKTGPKHPVKGNYTINNIMSLVDTPESKELWGKVDKLLDTVVFDGASNCDGCLVNYECEQIRKIEDCPVAKDITLREVLKTMADKTICHYDNFYKNGDSWDYIMMLKSMMYDENQKVNIDFMITSLKDIFHDGISIKLPEDISR